MKLLTIGVGQGGSMVAQEMLLMGMEVLEKRGLRILAGKENNPLTGEKVDPITSGVFAINSASTDLNALTHIPKKGSNRIIMENKSGISEIGTGKNNLTGALLAEGNTDKVLKILAESKTVKNSDAILLIASTSGGTGSGGIGIFAEAIKKSFDRPVYVMLLLPFASEYKNPAAMENTATCLAKVLGAEEEGENKKTGADAVILVDNQVFMDFDRAVSGNLQLLNQRIVYSFRDILCASAETKPEFGSENAVDVADVTETLRGITSIGISHLPLPKPLILRVRRKKPDYDEANKRINSAIQLLEEAFDRLSIACESENEPGKKFYSAGEALCLFSSVPSFEASSGIVGRIEGFFAERVPGAKLRRGTYSRGKHSDSIGFTVILSNIGRGAAADKVAWFLEQGASAQDNIDETTASIEDAWNRALEKTRKLRRRL